MQTVNITASAEYQLQYDVNSKEFKDTLKEYREIIDKNADEYDVLKSVVHHLSSNGRTIDVMIEGIGYVWKIGRKGKQPFSGIYIVNDDPIFDYEIQ